MIGPKIGIAYSRLDLIVDLYMMVIDSLSWLQSVPASAFRAFNLVLPHLTTASTCGPNLYLGSSIRPSTLVFLSTGTMVSLSLTSGL